MPKAYQYDEETKKYKGEINRQRDPRASEKAGHDVWLLPANSTDVPPLKEKEGFDVVWNGKKWEYQEIPQPQPEPEPSEDEKKERVRSVRNSYLVIWDFSQLRDAPFTQAEQDNLAEYRQYLRDYTKTDNWWESLPKTYDEWK